MNKVKNKILMLTITIIIIFGMVGFALYRDGYIASLLFYEPYKYNFFCSKKGENCLTIITYSRPNIGDTPFKRYVVFGKNKFKLPIKANNIEFPNDTGLVIIWESALRCKIISNQPAQKVMELSPGVTIDIVYNNNLYEEYAEKFPDFSL